MISQHIHCLAIATGGGDAPGLNPVIRAATLSAINLGWKVVGIRDGFNGVLSPESFSEANPGLITLNAQAVRGITHLGGTILGTTNRGNPMKFPAPGPDGDMILIDRTPELVDKLRHHGIDALITVGGDGSMLIAERLSSLGFPVVGVPKTIDNDLIHTEETFGFDSAVSYATDALDRLHSTAASHGRTMVMEVMGRYAGWIALHVGIAGTADVILLPEIPYDHMKILAKVAQRYESGRGFATIVVAEGAKPIGGQHSVIGQSLGQAERLGGAGQRVADFIGEHLGVETRCTVLGHLQRGGSPTAYDRLLSLRFGSAAVRTLAEGESGVMVVLAPPHVRRVPLKDIVGRLKTVPLHCDTIATARALGTCLGD